MYRKFAKINAGSSHMSLTKFPFFNVLHFHGALVKTKKVILVCDY